MIYYTHYSFMIYGHARIPDHRVVARECHRVARARSGGWPNDLRLHKRPDLGIAKLPTTRHNTIDQILAELVEREEAGVQLYRDLMEMVKDKSIALEEYAQRLIAAEVVHIREMELMLMKSAPE